MDHRESVYRIVGSFDGEERIVASMKRIQQQGKETIRASQPRAEAAQQRQRAAADRAGMREVRGRERVATREADQAVRTAVRSQRDLYRQQGRLRVEDERAQRRAHREEEQRRNRRFEGLARTHSFSREAGYELRRQTDSLREYSDEAMRLARSQAQFKVVGLSPEENERAFQAARKAANEYKLDLAQTVDMVADMQTATGKLDVTLEHLALASKFKFAFSTLFGDRFNPEELQNEIQNAFKFLESTGALAKGKEETEKRFNAIAQMMAVSAGRVRPSDLMQLAKRGGPAVQSLSVSGLRTMGTLVPEMGGSGVGTSLMTMYQSMGGILQKSAAEEFMRLGLLKPMGVKFTSAGIRSHIKKGAFGKFGDTMMEDPLAGADMLVKAMRAKGIDTTKDNEIRKELLILFQARTAQRLMSTLTTQRSQILSQRKLMEGAPDIPAMFAEAGETPMGKMEKFQNALANLRMEIGGPLLTSLTSVAGAAMPFLRLAAAHPEIALTTIMTLKLAKAVGTFAAVTQSSGLISIFGGGIGRGAGAGRTAGRTAASLGLARGAGLAAGLAWTGGLAIAIAGVSLVIARAFDDAENERIAGEAGERIGGYLRERFRNQIEGKLSKDVQDELDKGAAPNLAKNIIEQQGLESGGTGGRWNITDLGKVESDFLQQLRSAAHFRDLAGKNPAWEKEAKEKESPLVANLYTSGIMSASHLVAYLAQARAKLHSAGRDDLYAELERLAGQAFPGLALELTSQAVPALSAFGQAVGLATGQVNLFRLTPRTDTPTFGFTPRGRGLGLDGKKSQFHIPGGGYARGGIALTPQLSVLAERGPEMVLPQHYFERLASAPTSVTPVTLNSTVNITLSGPVSPETTATLRREVGSAVRMAGKEVLAVLESKYREAEAAS